MPLYGKTVKFRTTVENVVYMSGIKVLGTSGSKPIAGSVQKEAEQNWPYTYPASSAKLL